jgi:hypothetical protein
LIQELNQTIADYLNEGETVFLVDSIPLPICQRAREKLSKRRIEILFAQLCDQFMLKRN